MQDEAAVIRGLCLWTALVLAGAGMIGMVGLHFATFWWDAAGR